MRENSKLKNFANNYLTHPINSRGITLVALVVTIVVLIILAVVSIGVITGKDGLINRAQKATEYYSNSSKTENDGLLGVSNYIDQLRNGLSDSDVVNEDEQNIKQQETLDSIKVLHSGYSENGINANTYFMDYTADYKFNKFLESGGAARQNEINEFASENLLDNQPVNCEMTKDIFCSTFSYTDINNRTIFGRNLDVYDETPILIVRTNPVNVDFKSISIVYLGMFTDFKNGITENMTDETKKQLLMAPYMPLDGINEKGLSIALLALNNKYSEQDRGKTQITPTTAIRLVLDKAENVDQAIELLDNYDMRFDESLYSIHFQITDALGNSAVVEWVEGSIKVIRKDISKRYQICTNTYISTDAEYNINNTTSSNNKDSMGRYNTLNETLSKQPNNYEIIITEAFQYVLGPVENWTIWSIAYDNTDKKAYFVPYLKYADNDDVIQIDFNSNP